MASNDVVLGEGYSELEQCEEKREMVAVEEEEEENIDEKVPLEEEEENNDKKEEEEEDDDDDDDADDDGIPYDHGWAWMATLGVFVNYVIMSGYSNSRGLFFVELLAKFGAPASRTALFFSVRHAVYSVCGFYVMNVCIKRFKVRNLALIGGILISLSAILSSQANGVMVFIFVQSGLLAVGHSMVCTPGVVFLSNYFKKRHYLALCIAECGVSVGRIAIPPLVSYLLEQCALQGTLLIFGAVCLHTLPAALLLRPVSYFSSKHRRCRHIRIDLDRTPADSDEENEPESCRDTPISGSCRRTSDGAKSQGRSSQIHISNQFLGANGNSASSQVLTKQVSTNCGADDFLSEYTQCVNGNTATRCTTEKSCRRVRKTSCRPVRCFRSSSKEDNARLLDFSLFRNPMFCLFMLFCLVVDTLAVPLEYLPALASECGLTEAQSGQLLSIAGVMDLVCRVMCSLIVYSKRIRVTTLVIFTLFVLGLMMQFVSLIDSFTHFVVFTVFIGLLGNTCFCLYAVLTIELVGIDNMPKAMGWANVASLIPMSSLHPLLGYIRDSTGSYVIVFHVIGGCILLTAVILGFEGPARRLQTRMQRRSTEQKLSQL